MRKASQRNWLTNVRKGEWFQWTARGFQNQERARNPGSETDRTKGSSEGKDARTLVYLWTEDVLGPTDKGPPPTGSMSLAQVAKSQERTSNCPNLEKWLKNKEIFPGSLNKFHYTVKFLKRQDQIIYKI